ncbi:MAG TPA: GNAT family protein [Gemmatimonadales bacterium]|nr:GNAT family protein [Gemmatimonadales bacterium]
MELPCTPDTRLRTLGLDDGPVLLGVLDADRATFDQWLRWSGTLRTSDDARAFIGRALDAEEAGRGFHWGLWRGDTLLGGVPCWSLDPVHRVAELGYWLAASARGSGLATTATQMAIRFLIAERQVNRVEFQCRVENEASRRVAERVGGRLEGIRRQSHWIGGAFRDHAVYSVLADDRPAATGSPEVP